MVVLLPPGHSFIAHQSILNKGLILYLSIKMITSVMWIPPQKSQVIIVWEGKQP